MKIILINMRKQKTIRFSLDIKPLSVNSCWQGKRFLNKQGKNYIETCLWKMPKGRIIKGICEVWIRVYLKKRWLAMDIDNVEKLLLDCLVKKKIIEDDRFITDLHIKKRQADRDWIEIEIQEKQLLNN